MSTMRSALGRGGLLAALLALALAFAAPAANATPPEEAAAWLAEQLQPELSPEYCETEFEGPSIGATIDCNLAFKAAGMAQEQEDTYAWILAEKEKYIKEKPCPESPLMSAGAIAKMAFVVEANGGDPRKVEGRDLIADLLCLQSLPGEPGRFKDKGGTDFSNTFGQSLAIIALEGCLKIHCETPGSLAGPIAEGAAYLVGQQCAEVPGLDVGGAFRLPLGLAASPCNHESPFKGGFNENAVEVDSTATAAQVLLTQATMSSEESAEDALIWLLNEEATSNYWESYCDQVATLEPFPSVNSTALTVMAYSQEGEAGEEEAGPAREWLESTVTNLGGEGMPACHDGGEVGAEGDVLATAQGILGLYAGTTYPRLVGLP